MDHDRIADEKFGTLPGRTGEGLYFYRVLPLANLEVLYKKKKEFQTFAEKQTTSGMLGL